MLTANDGKLLAALLVAARGGQVLFYVPNYRVAHKRFRRAYELLCKLGLAPSFVFRLTCWEITCPRTRGRVVIAAGFTKQDDERIKNRFRGVKFDNRFRDESYDDPREVADAGRVSELDGMTLYDALREIYNRARGGNPKWRMDVKVPSVAFSEQEMKLGRLGRLG